MKVVEKKESSQLLLLPFVQSEGGSTLQLTTILKFQLALRLLPLDQEVMSSKHGCNPEVRGQRKKKGGAVFSRSLVSQAAVAKWRRYESLLSGNYQFLQVPA